MFFQICLWHRQCSVTCTVSAHQNDKCWAGAQLQGLVRCQCCVQVRWAGDRCTVCDSDVDYDQDQLVSCDMCGITVHQSCYGVQELPGEDDMWLCRACELKVTSTRKLIPLHISSCCWDAYLTIASLRMLHGLHRYCLRAHI